MKIALTYCLTLCLAFGAFSKDESGQAIKSKKTGLKPICTNEGGDTLYMGHQSTIFIWYVPTGRLIKKVKTNVPIITSVTNANKNNCIVIGGNTAFGKGRVSYLNRQTLRNIQTIECKKRVLAIAVSGNEKRLAVSAEKKIRIYPFLKTDSEFTLENDFHSLALSLSDDGNLLAYGGANKRAILFSLENKKEVGSVGHGNWVRRIQLSYSGKFMVSAGDDESIYLSDISKESFENKILSGHKNRIYALEFSPDEKYIISGSTDQTYKIWDVNSKTLKDDYSTKPHGGVSHIAFASGCKQVIASPVLSKSLPVLDVSHLKIVPRNRLQRNDEDKDPPQIYVSSPEKVGRERIITYKDPFPVTGTVIDEFGLRKVLINGQEIMVRENGNFAQFMPLAYGDNPITIEATDINGNISVKKFTLVRKSTYGEITDTSKSKNFLMVIGINKYEHWPELNNAVNDAESVKEVLLGKYDFDNAETTVLINEDATRNNIYHAMRKYIELVGPNDNLLIYYAGHGYFDELINEGYWVPVEANLKQEAEYLPNTTILKIIGNINSKHTFLVADACFSGSLFAERERGYSDNVERFKSRWGLASGRLEEVSDGSGKHSPFASSFVNCLNKSEKNNIPASEVIQYVKQNVAEMTNQTPRGNPLKNVGDEGGEFVFKKKKP